jgi:YegS/Rv2252/BmrU family lipid kinase
MLILMQKIGIIINATAGSSKGKELASRISAIFERNGVQARIKVANGKQISAIARAMRDKHYDLIVAAGGDGTVSTVASQIVECDVVLGVLPLGTLNHFARDLGIPLDLEEAADAICRGEVRAVDIGSVNEKFFINNSSLGLYADQVRLRQVWRKRIGRWPALIVASIVTLVRYRHLRITANFNGQSVSRHCPLALISNNEYRLEPGNLTERKQLEGGLLGIYLLRDEGRMGLLRIAMHSFVQRLEEASSFEHDTSAEVIITMRRKRIHVALDGEVCKLNSPLRYSSMHGGLRVITPKREQAQNPLP